MSGFSKSLHTSRYGNCDLRHTHAPDVAALLLIGVRWAAAARVCGTPCIPIGKWTGLAGSWGVPDWRAHMRGTSQEHGQEGWFQIGKFTGIYFDTNLLGSCGSVEAGCDGTGCSVPSESPQAYPCRCEGLSIAQLVQKPLQPKLEVPLEGIENTINNFCLTPTRRLEKTQMRKARKDDKNGTKKKMGLMQCIFTEIELN